MWSNMSVIPMNQDFQENRLLMSFVNFHEQEKISKEIVTHAIESCMKKQADNLLNSLDVISGRLSQLELYCYILEMSIGELRSDVMDYHNEANLNFRCVEKQVKEVYHDALGTSTTVCCEVSSPLTLNALCLVSKFSVTRFGLLFLVDYYLSSNSPKCWFMTEQYKIYVMNGQCFRTKSCN